MPRAARAFLGGICYDVFNRGNACADVFHKDGEFTAFLKVVRPHKDGDLSRWVQWLVEPGVAHFG